VDARAAIPVDDGDDQLGVTRDGQGRYLAVERRNGTERRRVLRRTAASGGRPGDEDDDG
jgi:hypothetical protein